MPTPRTLYAKSGDVHLAYQAIGDGPRDVFLVLDWASHLEVVERGEHSLKGVPESWELYAASG